MAKNEIIVTVTPKWWFKYLYLPGMCLTLAVARFVDPSFEPDIEKMSPWVERGFKILPGTMRKIRGSHGKSEEA
jgi:hypothetical protein